MKHDRNHLIAVAANLMARRWPEAHGGFAGGSMIRGQGKPLSDIDLIVLLPHQDHPRKYWLREEGIPFDVFCHDEGSLRHYVADNWKERRPVLLGIIAEGEPLPELNPVLRKWQRYARRVLKHGLPPLQEDERDLWRYRLMDQLEDYEDANDPAECRAIAAQLHLMLLDAICLLGHGQLGNGKWRGRLAQRADAGLVWRVEEACIADFQNPGGKALLALGDSILDRLGGRFAEEHCNHGPATNRKEKITLLRPR